MPAMSFQREFLDALLRGDKRQTTRRQTDRIKVGDIAHIYIEQRGCIIDKPLRRLTSAGHYMMCERNYKPSAFDKTLYYAHFIGKVQITDVFDVVPANSCNKTRWAVDDGFANFDDADDWFVARYGERWMCRTWTVIKWNGWAERHFEAEQP